MTPISLGALVLGLTFAVTGIGSRHQVLAHADAASTATLVVGRLVLYGMAVPLIAIRVLANTFTPFLYFQF
jgi:hypothetical protein